MLANPEEEGGCPTKKRIPSVLCGYPGRQQGANAWKTARFLFVVSEQRSSSTLLAQSLVDNEMHLPNALFRSINHGEPFFADPADITAPWSYESRCSPGCNRLPGRCPLYFLGDMHQTAELRDSCCLWQR